MVRFFLPLWSSNYSCLFMFAVMNTAVKTSSSKFFHLSHVSHAPRIAQGQYYQSISSDLTSQPSAFTQLAPYYHAVNIGLCLINTRSSPKLLPNYCQVKTICFIQPFINLATWLFYQQSIKVGSTHLFNFNHSSIHGGPMDTLMSWKHQVNFK